MGCGASRGASQTTTLSFVARVEKERDDATLETIQLKRLGVGAYDTFFTAFENGINNVVNLNNTLHDVLWDVKAALAYASSPDPEYTLDLEVATDNVRSVPQLLLEVLYAESNSRPLPFEVRHLLTSRPAVAEADRAIAEAMQDLVSSLQLHPAPVQLSYDERKMQLSVIPCGSGSAVPGASKQYQRLQQRAAKVSSALAAMRKAAPGLRLVVLIVPTPYPGARTFSWRLLPRLDGVEGQAVLGGATSNPAAPVRAGSGPVRRVASPLRIASAHGAAAIVAAANTVAQQAAAIAAAVTAPAAPLTQLQLQGRRRLVAIMPPEGLTAAAAAAVANGPRNGRNGNLILRSLSFSRTEPSSASGSGVSVSKGISAASRADEAAVVLRRAVSNANHALFRLAKCATAGASSGRDAAAWRHGDPSSYPISRAMTVVLEAAIHAARLAAGVSGVAATPPACEFGRGGGGTAAATAATTNGAGSVFALSGNDLVVVEPLLQSTSDSGSVLSSSAQGWPAGGGGGGGGDFGDGDGAAPGWSWSWDWGIKCRVSGVSFPECLPPKPRAVYDAVNRAVETARSITEKLPVLQRDVANRLEEAEAVFRRSDDQLTARDMMSAGRMRAALDRNANTVSASPALVGLLRSAVVRLTDELRRGAEQMRAVAHGDQDADDTREGRDSSQRGSGSRSIMAHQLNKAAAVAAAAVAAAAAAAAAAEDDDETVTADGRSEAMSGLGSESGGGDGGSLAGDSADDADGMARGGVRRTVSQSGDGSDGGTGRGSSNAVRRDAGGGGGGGAGAARGAGGKLAGRAAKGNAVSRRVVLPPLSRGSSA